MESTPHYGRLDKKGATLPGAVGGDEYGKLDQVCVVQIFLCTRSYVSMYIHVQRKIGTVLRL